MQQGPNGSYVYVIGLDRTVQMRPVTVSQISEGQALIDAGLKSNENVVVEGQYRLQPGSLVEELHGKAAQEADLESSVEQAIPRMLGDTPDVVLIDIGLPGMSGIEGIRVLKEKYPRAQLLVLTVYGDGARIFEALCAGA